MADSPALPKPVQRPRPPIIVGGVGPTRTPRLAARFADEYNVPFRTVAETEAAYGRVREACAKIGRESIRLSAAQTIVVGANEAEAKRRAEAIGRDLAELREAGLGGTPGEVLEKIGEFAKLGCERLYLQILDLNDLEHLELIAAEILPHV